MVTQEEYQGRRRWVCAKCPWATEWTMWTSAPDAVAAIRHQLDHQKEGAAL